MNLRLFQFYYYHNQIARIQVNVVAHSPEEALELFRKHPDNVGIEPQGYTEEMRTLIVCDRN